MTRLSVNINKIATLRNARGGDVPNLVKMACDIEAFGAEGITVHPRPDERHITRQDVYDLKDTISTEFNIEGYPSPEFCDLVLEIQPAQVTLVPDAPDQLTSDHGWDTITHHDFLQDVVRRFKSAGIRVSIFVDPKAEMIDGAKAVGADRVELYTAMYAEDYAKGREEAIAPYLEAAQHAKAIGIGLNAGHDLSLENLTYFHQQIPWLDEVSIGHAVISDALYLGMKTTVEKYLDCLK
jgi:pyridoxine 5-phosphate synthase